MNAALRTIGTLFALAALPARAADSTDVAGGRDVLTEHVAAAEPVATEAPRAASGLLSGNGPLDAGAIGEVLLALVFVIAIIGLMAWLARRSGHPMVGGNTVAMRVLGGLSVGQRERVVLVQVGERQVLLGVSPGRVCALSTLEPPVAASAPVPDGTRPLLDLIAGRSR